MMVEIEEEDGWSLIPEVGRKGEKAHWKIIAVLIQRKGGRDSLGYVDNWILLEHCRMYMKIVGMDWFANSNETTQKRIWWGVCYSNIEDLLQRFDDGG